MLTGERIYLRAMEERDIPSRVRWYNDPEVRNLLQADFPMSEVGTRQWLGRVALDATRKDLVICLQPSDSAIGCTGLLNINRRDSKAEIYVMIGQKEHWGHGYGQEAQRLLLHFGFLELGLNRIYAYTRNERAVALYKALGFQVEGTLRDDVFAHGHYHDRVVMGITALDYQARST